MLSWLFRKKSPLSMRDVEQLAGSLAAPAIHLVLGDIASKSHVGGSPALPRDIAWPECNGKRLDFLARFSLSEMQAVSPIPWLPQSGAVLFFYDIEAQPWGYDPQNRGRWSVLLVDDLPASADPTDFPSAESRPRVPFRYARAEAVRTLPSSEREAAQAFDLNDAESDELSRLADLPFADRPKHQIAGFPSPVQGDDMELQCQLASHGLNCGTAAGYADPRATSLGPGAAEWRLLLQFDSDDELGLMWGDCGMLYFWVQEAEARQGRFSNVWLVLQCA